MARWSVFTHERISPRGFTGSRSILDEPADAGREARRHTRASPKNLSNFSCIAIRSRADLFKQVQALNAREPPVW